MADWDDAFWPGIDSAPRIRDTRSGHFARYVPDLLNQRPMRFPLELGRLAAQVEMNVRKLDGNPGSRGLEALSRFLLRSEAIASSRIEGLSVSPQNVGLAELMQANELPQARADSAAFEVAALIATVREATQRIADTDVVQASHVETLQQLLVGKDSPLSGVRKEQNWIGGSDYHPLEAEFVPPEPRAVPPLLDDLAAFMNRGDQAALVQAALVHAQFETVHPFRDGNGRVGRALIHTVLVRRGLTRTALLPISAVLLTQSDQYVAGLTAYRYRGPIESDACASAIAQWVRVFLLAVDTSVKLAQQFADELEDLRGEWDEALASHRKTSGVRAAPRTDSATARILATLQENPILTPTIVRRHLDISQLSARNALETMADAGILTRRRLDGRTMCYLATAVFDMIALSERALSSTKWDTRESAPIRTTPARPPR